MKKSIQNIIGGLCVVMLPMTMWGMSEGYKPLSCWRFELGMNIPSDSLAPVCIGDDFQNGNVLQLKPGVKASELFSHDVPFQSRDGVLNRTSLKLNNSEFKVPFTESLPFSDIQYGWKISLSLKCNQLGTEQVFLCKEGKRGTLTGDISIGFDPMERKFFVEVATEREETVRMVAGEEVKAGVWYDLYACTAYEKAGDKTVLKLGVKPSADTEYKEEKVSYRGLAVRHNAGMWVVGRGFPGGFPNSLQVLDGYIDEVSIKGMERPYEPGQNPLFRDEFTADPAVMVYKNKAYAYVGVDKAGVGGWFNMPGWLCYSSEDMKTWTPHGMVLRASDFANSNPYGAWAAQVVESNGKFYFYVTLDRKDNSEHKIDVAVGDSPLGPFKPVRTDGTPLITDSMTRDSHRWNADIDPTVWIDEDGTPWMAWGNGDCYMVKLKKNMIELDGEIRKVPYRNYSEGPWLFKRNNLYYNIYAADAPGTQPEQICYSTAEDINGPWTYRGFITGPANFGFTIHPSVVELNGQWYFFYHDGSYSLDGQPGGDCRRHVCVEYLYFNEDGTIQPIELTSSGVSDAPRK